MATKLELAYLAGVLDGEGHFAQPLRGDGKLILCMADTRILDWINERFPASYSQNWQDAKSPGSRPRRMWQMHDQGDLIVLLPRIIPLLVLKREEAKVLLEATQYRTARAGRGKRPTPEHKARLQFFATAMLQAREARK